METHASQLHLINLSEAGIEIQFYLLLMALVMQDPDTAQSSPRLFLSLIYSSINSERTSALRESVASKEATFWTRSRRARQIERQWQLRTERAQYEADPARRRYMAGENR